MSDRPLLVKFIDIQAKRPLSLSLSQSETHTRTFGAMILSIYFIFSIRAQAHLRSQRNPQRQRNHLQSEYRALLAIPQRKFRVWKHSIYLQNKTCAPFLFPRHVISGSIYTVGFFSRSYLGHIAPNCFLMPMASSRWTATDWKWVGLINPRFRRGLRMRNWLNSAQSRGGTRKFDSGRHCAGGPRSTKLGQQRGVTGRGDNGLMTPSPGDFRIGMTVIST